MRDMGNLGAVNNSVKEAKFSTTRSLKNSSNYSSRPMSSIAEIGDKGNRENNQENDVFGENRGNDYISEYQVDTWDDTEMMSENVGGLKRFRDNDSKQQFSGLNASSSVQVEYYSNFVEFCFYLYVVFKVEYIINFVCEWNFHLT